MRLWIPLIALAILVVSTSGRAAYPGDSLLNLTGSHLKSTTRMDAINGLNRLFDHLQVPPDVRARYAYMNRANLQKSQDYFEAGELSETVLVATGGVRIGFARNVFVIAGGEVDIAHASGVVILSRGSIRISHDQSPAGPPGFYVTNGTSTIGSATGASLYAVAGAEFSHTGTVTAYNTDIRSSMYGITNRIVRPPIFRDEPERPATPPSMMVSTGESMDFKGRRCAYPAPHGLLADRLPVSARRELNCPRITSITVVCGRDSPTPEKSSSERWSFEGCGRMVHFDVEFSTSGNASALNIGKPLHGTALAGTESTSPKVPTSPAMGPEKVLTPEESRKISGYFQEALEHQRNRDLLQARAAYARTFEIDPDHRYAKGNIASVDANIVYADSVAATHNDRISKGDRSARTLANRGMAYFSAGDAGRGLPDLEEAQKRSTDDLSIALDRARAYLLINRTQQAAAIATDLLAKHPRLAKAYEIRAWAHLVENRNEAAYRDAFSSLVEVPEWTPATFARDDAAYRLIVGYFALRKELPRAKAVAWLRDWRAMLDDRRWPDAGVLFLLGELDEKDMLSVASSGKTKNRSQAIPEAQIFLAIERNLAGNSTEGVRLLREIPDTIGGEPTLARLLRHRAKTLTERTADTLRIPLRIQ